MAPFDRPCPACNGSGSATVAEAKADGRPTPKPLVGDRAPSGCRWCGVSTRDHASRYTTGVGWHIFTLPTNDQTLTRMRQRRAERAAWHRAHGYDGHRHRLIEPDHQDAADPFDPDTAPPNTRATRITDDEVIDRVTTDRWLRWDWLHPEDWTNELFDAPSYR
ncbi:hypothetical protein [Nocardiopsis rhodophaea]|uniref:hypothetical protein n=1 Tax=Nocardiopsis rhodophaea TaxID=280238 RepID=UPI0031D54EF0